MAIVVTDKNFKEEVLESKIAVLVDFWASWCPPCKMVEPTLQELSDDLKDTLISAKINVDQNPVNAKKYKIMGVPTFVIFNEGKEQTRRIGAQSKQQLVDMLEKAGITGVGIKGKTVSG